MIAMALVVLAQGGAAAAGDLTDHQLEGRRIRAPIVYVGTVSAVHRLGALDGLTAERQGRMEATVRVAQTLRAPAAVARTDEVAVRFDSRAPDPDGDGFITLAPGDALLVFADVLEPAYAREVFHGRRDALATEVKALRDVLAGMDPTTMRLHDVSAATRASQLRLYDQALAAIARLPASSEGR